MANLPLGFGSRSNQCLFARNGVTSKRVEEVRRILPNSFAQGTKQTPSFAAVVNSSQTKVGRDIDLATLPVPGKQGSFPIVKLAKTDVLKGIDQCKWALVGRLDFLKTNILKVRYEISSKWELKGPCKAIPLGRGYLMLNFEYEEDYCKIWGRGTWIIDGQALRLSKWTPNFNTASQTTSHALVWVRFPGLSQEYWEVRSLMSIARALGHPMHIDDNTARHNFGYYASVLVDIDLAETVPDKVWVEVDDTNIAFWQPVELGKVPKFCSNCKKVGHNLAECRVVKDAMAKQVQVEAMGNGEIAGQSRNQRRKDNIKNRVENAVQIESVIAEDARDAIVVGFEVNEKNVGAEIVKEVGSNSEARIGQPTNQFSPLAEMNNEEILEEHAIEGGQETHITEAVVEQHNVLMLSERIEDQTITLDSNANEENIMSVDPKGAPISASLKVIQEATAIKARLVELESNRQAIVKAGETKKSPTKGKKIQNKEVYKDLGPPTTRSKAK